MANHMAEVAKILGVEIDEVFNIDGYDDEYKITSNNGLMYRCGGDCIWETDDAILLNSILLGESEIIKKQWKPQKGDVYWRVGLDGNLLYEKWQTDDSLGLMSYAIGNCFRTEAEAVAHRGELLARLKAKYEKG